MLYVMRPLPRTRRRERAKPTLPNKGMSEASWEHSLRRYTPARAPAGRSVQATPPRALEIGRASLDTREARPVSAWTHHPSLQASKVLHDEMETLKSLVRSRCKEALDTPSCAPQQQHNPPTTEFRDYVSALQARLQVEHATRLAMEQRMQVATTVVAPPGSTRASHLHAQMSKIRTDIAAANTRAVTERQRAEAAAQLLIQQKSGGADPVQQQSIAAEVHEARRSSIAAKEEVARLWQHAESHVEGLPLVQQLQAEIQLARAEREAAIRANAQAEKRAAILQGQLEHAVSVSHQLEDALGQPTPSRPATAPTTRHVSTSQPQQPAPTPPVPTPHQLPAHRDANGNAADGDATSVDAPTGAADDAETPLVQQLRAEVTRAENEAQRLQAELIAALGAAEAGARQLQAQLEQARSGHATELATAEAAFSKELTSMLSALEESQAQAALRTSELQAARDAERKAAAQAEAAAKTSEQQGAEIWRLQRALEQLNESHGAAQRSDDEAYASGQ